MKDDLPRDELMKLASDTLQQYPGAEVHFKFTCSHCGERCTLEVWGSFSEFTSTRQRLYIRAYWRFLLGWQLPPARTGIHSQILRDLRRRAREEVHHYQDYVRFQGGAIVYAYQEIRGPPKE